MRSDRIKCRVVLHHFAWRHCAGVHWCDKALVTRVTEITQRFNAYGNKIWDYEQKNHLLQKAITLYLADIIDLRNKNAHYNLLDKPKRKKHLGQVITKDLDDDSCDGDTSVSSYSGTVDGSVDEDDEAYYGVVDSLDGLNVQVMPPHNEWIYIGNGVRFMHEQEAPPTSDSKTPAEAKVRFILESSAANGSKRIDALIKKAYKQYQDDERRHIEDKARYFYIQLGTKGGSESEVSTVAYKRYTLGEDKTFDNLFFEEKDQVLQLLDNYTKAGKFEAMCIDAIHENEMCVKKWESCVTIECV